MYLDVLIVEDEEKILDVIEAYLKKDGFNTIRAVDGEEALEKFEIFSPDIVILDLMPKQFSESQSISYLFSHIFECISWNSNQYDCF